MTQTGGFITVNEAARRLDRSIEQVRRYLREGKLKGARVGQQWFIEEASLHQLTTRGRPLSRGTIANESELGEAFRLNLRAVEGVFGAELAVWPTTARDREAGYPPGVTISADRKAHGAELHLKWEDVRALRDALDRLLNDARVIE
ncbi:MAG: helix-turn-helix domain-containing protein [Chloroflexi bacterium]|nr:helix-turn-helix domain-containing protein [Chloroflexota bacterium]